MAEQEARQLEGHITSFEQAEAAVVKAEAGRPIIWFDLPDHLADESGITKVALIENKASEELMAANRAAGDQVRLGIELAKQSLRFVNDGGVNTGDGSLERFWDSAHPGYSKVRQLIMAAYMSIHNATDEEAKTFLGSRRVTV